MTLVTLPHIEGIFDPLTYPANVDLVASKDSVHLSIYCAMERIHRTLRGLETDAASLRHGQLS